MILYLILSVITITLANIIKIKRQIQFIEPYEKPNDKLLIKSLAIGNIFNLFLPFRLGYLIRAYVSGKRMKNGTTFSLSTILVEVFLDFMFVPIIYVIFYGLGFKFGTSIIFYLVMLLIICISIFLLEKYKKYIKFIIYKIASIFNEYIELRILKTSWFTIVSFENIVSKVNKLKLIYYSFIMWILNIISCYFLSVAFRYNNLNESIFNLFNFFYSNSGITSSFLFNANQLSLNFIQLILIYYVCGFILLIASSYFVRFKNTNSSYLEILPHVNTTNKLDFLEHYFNGGSSDYYKKYMKMNEDVAILEDYSSGSNATTLLCSKNGRVFYRKYSFGKDALKLKQQVDWIVNHENALRLTQVKNVQYDAQCCSYDMPFVDNSISCFNYVHTVPFKDAWSTLENVLNDLRKNLHSLNLRTSNTKDIEKYIKEKVEKNLNIIENSVYIKPLLKYDFLYINGKKYHNLKYLKKYLSYEYLIKVFENDKYSDIHGDFTIENIICLKDAKKFENYYIIDPNTGNIHESPYLDFAKLLQSIHGGYEFLMRTKKVDIIDNHIDYLFTKSETYYKLYEKLVEYFKKHFDEQGIKSIFFHEIVHWLRLLPYKIEKNGQLSVLFYARFIIVANEIIELFKEGE